MKPLLSIRNRVRRNTLLLTLATSAFLSSTFAMADTYAIDNLIVDKVYTFATPPGAQSAGGYLTITNTGPEDDTLIGGTSSFSNVTQVHEMKMVEDVMKMRHLPNGLSIPAGATVELVPGGFHMMFMQLTQSLKDGESFGGTLKFSKAGELPVDFKVIDRRNQESGHDMKHGHEPKAESESQSSMKHDSTGHGSTNHGATGHGTKKE